MSYLHPVIPKIYIYESFSLYFKIIFPKTFFSVQNTWRDLPMVPKSSVTFVVNLER